MSRIWVLVLRASSVWSCYLCLVVFLCVVWSRGRFCSGIRNGKLVSWREGESGEECAGGEWFSAGSLEVGDPEMVLAASDYDAVWRDFGDSSGFEFGSGLGLGSPKFNREEFVVFLQMAEGSGPGIESADLVGEFGCRSAPVDFAVAPGEFSGVGGA